MVVAWALFKLDMTIKVAYKLLGVYLRGKK